MKSDFRMVYPSKQKALVFLKQLDECHCWWIKGVARSIC